MDTIIKAPIGQISDTAPLRELGTQPSDGTEQIQGPFLANAVTFLN